jgi:predicted nucleotidyltransferase component of viral defense system
MPMFCELGLGIMEIRGTASEDKPVPTDTFLLVDGGFALISSNVVTIIAYDVLTIQDILAEKPQRLLKDVLARPISDGYSLQQRQHDIARNAFIEKLSRMASSTL